VNRLILAAIGLLAIMWAVLLVALCFADVFPMGV